MNVDKKKITYIICSKYRILINDIVLNPPDYLGNAKAIDIKCKGCDAGRVETLDYNNPSLYESKWIKWDVIYRVYRTEIDSLVNKIYPDKIIVLYKEQQLLIKDEFETTIAKVEWMYKEGQWKINIL